MTAVNFAYWLQGFFELSSTQQQANMLTIEQINIIKRHLALVFVHDIDPNAGPKPHQDNLNAIHNTQSPPEGSGITYRC